MYMCTKLIQDLTPPALSRRGIMVLQDMPDSELHAAKMP